MFETVAVLVIFFFIFAFGIAFYFYISASTSVEEFDRQLELRAIQRMQTVISLPELECSIGKTRVQNCLDVQRLKSFSKVLEDENYRQEYFEYLKFSDINIDIYYPPKYNQSIAIYEHPVKYKESIQLVFPIRVYDIVTKTYAYGLLRVRQYGA